MQVSPLRFDGVYRFDPVLLPDDRGVFLESFKSDLFTENVGHAFDGSPTFGECDAVELSAEARTGLYIPEGFGHAFCALSDSATVGYLCSQGYSPSREHGIHPLDPVLALPWPASASPVLSPKDAAAPTFLQAQESSSLPSFDACREYVSTLREST